MTLYAHNLPLHVRKRLPATTPMRQARAAADTTAAVKHDAAAGWFRCHRCGATNTAYARAEDHAHRFAGHASIDWVWATDEGAEVGA